MSRIKVLSGLDFPQDGFQIVETLPANVKATGLIVKKTAGEALAFGEVVYFKSDGKAWKADASGVATAPAVAMAIAAISADAVGEFLLIGNVRNDTWAWTIGGLLYLSTTAGGLTQTQPNATDEVIQVLGIAHPNADTMYFRPDFAYITHV
jgi:hypothetical protein